MFGVMADRQVGRSGLATCLSYLIMYLNLVQRLHNVLQQIKHYPLDKSLSKLVELFSG